MGHSLFSKSTCREEVSVVLLVLSQQAYSIAAVEKEEERSAWNFKKMLPARSILNFDHSYGLLWGSHWYSSHSWLPLGVCSLSFLVKLHLYRIVATARLTSDSSGKKKWRPFFFPNIRTQILLEVNTSRLWFIISQAVFYLLCVLERELQLCLLESHLSALSLWSKLVFLMVAKKQSSVPLYGCLWRIF